MRDIFSQRAKQVLVHWLSMTNARRVCILSLIIKSDWQFGGIDCLQRHCNDPLPLATSIYVQFHTHPLAIHLSVDDISYVGWAKTGCVSLIQQQLRLLLDVKTLTAKEY